MPIDFFDGSFALSLAMTGKEYAQAQHMSDNDSPESNAEDRAAVAVTQQRRCYRATRLSVTFDLPGSLSRMIQG